MPFIQFILAFAMFIVFCQFNYGTIAQVQLKENVDIPVVIDGKPYGTNTLQTGTVFSVYEVKEDTILLKHFGKTIMVAKSKTDYDDQVNIIKAKEEEVRLAKEKEIQEQKKKELLEKEELAKIDADRALLKDKFPRQVMLNIKMDVTKTNPKDGKPYVYRSLPAGQLYTINNKPEYKIGNKLTLEYYECFVAVAISNTDLRERISAAKAQMAERAKELSEPIASAQLNESRTPELIAKHNIDNAEAETNRIIVASTPRNIPMEMIEPIIYIGIGLLLYFLPWLVAASRKKTNTGAIALLNLLLGWTFIGWVIALVWAVTKEKIDDNKDGPFLRS